MDWLESLSIWSGPSESGDYHTVLGWSLIVLGLLIAVFAIVWGRRRVLKANQKGVVVGRNNEGIIVTGNVKGNVTQNRDATASQSAESEVSRTPRWERVLYIMAAMSTIIGTVLIFFEKSS